MRSIRTFLTLALLSVVTLVNFAAALRGYHVSMTEAEALLDQRMQQQIELLDFTLPDLLQRGAIREGRLLGSAPLFSSDASLQFQWLSNDGGLLAHSVLMPATPIVALTPGYTFANFNGYRWHVLVAASSAAGRWIVLAERDDQRYRLAESVILPAVYPMLLAIPLLGLTIWCLLAVGLRPIRQLAIDLERREARDLRPLDDQKMPIELRQLAHAANALLARLEASFAREVRFSADAAHELRTPIAALSIQCENLALAAPEHVNAVAKLQTGVERMHHLVNQILMLNRIAPDHYMGRFVALDLTERVRHVVLQFSDVLQRKSLDIEADGGAAWINGDQYAMESLLGNLLSNAIKYSPPHGRIRIHTEASGGEVSLKIDDSGIGIPEDQRARVFDRFYRIGGDQHDPRDAGCGLGLSIVRQVADLHRASVRFFDSPLGGLRVELKMQEFTSAQITKSVAPHAQGTLI